MAHYSFSAAAGPLPASVAATVAEACRDWQGSGSVLGLSFVSERFKALQAATETALRQCLGIPKDFHILFLSGGASTQFAAVPLNLMAGRIATYIDAGHWSRRARDEATRYGTVRTLPLAALASVRSESVNDNAYWHVTSNETANGLQLTEFPCLPAPLVADMTSDFLTRPLPFDRLALAYAGTQKSIGVPGLTVIIIRDDLLGRAAPATPRVLDYTVQAASHSRVNTPPVFAIFVLHAMLDWIATQGGIAAMAAIAQRRSAAVYQAVDGNPHLRASVPPAFRSQINPCFQLADPRKTPHFLAAALAAGLHDLHGHPDVGGIRISLYNGLSEAAFTALTEFLVAYTAPTTMNGTNTP